MINRKFTNISMKALASLIGMKDADSRSVTRNAKFNRQNVYYLSAIRLFILLNFKCDTNSGKAVGLVAEDLAKEANICVKTVYASLNKLSSSQNGSEPLISYAIDLETDLISVSILNYSDMFKKRGNGGLGYLQFDDDLAERICMIKSINDMRVCIRALLECEEQGGYEATISMQQLRNAMPAYIKPCYIHRSLDALRGFFKERTNITKKAFHLSLNEFIRIPDKKRRLLSEGESNLRKLVDELNDHIEEINNRFLLSPDNPENRLSNMVSDALHQLTHINLDWRAAAAKGIKRLPKITYTSHEYADAANLMLQFGNNAVLYAVRKYYEVKSLKGIVEKNSSSKMATIRKIAESVFYNTREFDYVPQPVIF